MGESTLASGSLRGGRGATLEPGAGAGMPGLRAADPGEAGRGGCQGGSRWETSLLGELESSGGGKGGDVSPQPERLVGKGMRGCSRTLRVRRGARMAETDMGTHS